MSPGMGSRRAFEGHSAATHQSLIQSDFICDKFKAFQPELYFLLVYLSAERFPIRRCFPDRACNDSMGRPQTAMSSTNLCIEELLQSPLLWRAKGTDTSTATLRTGFAALDERLPGGGWPTQGLIE